MGLICATVGAGLGVLVREPEDPRIPPRARRLLGDQIGKRRGGNRMPRGEPREDAAEAQQVGSYDPGEA